MSPGGPLNLGPFEDLDRLALAQLHDRLLPARAAAADEAAPLRLRAHLDDVDGLHLDVEERRELLAPRLEKSRCTFRRRLGESRVVDQPERACLGVAGERCPKRSLPRLPVHLDVEVRPRQKRRAAAGPLRSAGRARPGPTRALLAPRLAAAAGYESAGLDAVSAGALRILLGAHRLMDEVRLDLGAEDGRLQRRVLGLLTGGIENRSLRSRHDPPPGSRRSRSSGREPRP